MRNIILLILVIFFIVFLYVYDNLVFGNNEFILGNFSYLSGKIENNYVNYFFKKNKQPIYIRNDNIFKKYMKECHDKKKNCLILPHQQSYADYIWMSSIQYIGSVIKEEKFNNLYPLLDNLTNISPYRSYPYSFGSLMLPISKTSNAGKDRKQRSWNESITIGEKGKIFNCDSKKINNILSLKNKEYFDIVSNSNRKGYKQPCDDYKIPYRLGFNYFHFLQDRKKSSDNYKIASFHKNVPDIASSMTSIVVGRAGNHLKSMQLRFTKLVSTNKQLKKANNKKERKLYSSQIKRYFKKATFELQLHIIKKAYSISDDDCERDYNCLLNKGYIKQIVSNIISECNGIKQFNIDNLDEKNQKIIDNTKCNVIGYSIQNGYINNKTGKLTYPFDSKFDFYRDDERSQRWIADFIKN